MNKYGHYMTVLDFSFCTVETTTWLWKFLHLLCHNVYVKSTKRPVLRPNLVEIEIIPWWTSAFVQLRQRRGFGNFFHLLCHNVYVKSTKRPVLRPNLVEIEIIPWCLKKALQILSCMYLLDKHYPPFKLSSSKLNKFTS